MEQNADGLRVAIHNSTALVCVRGQGSFKVAPSLKRFCVSAIEQGCKWLLLDMAECEGMDSTFMGVMAGLAMRMKRESGSGLVVMNLSPKTMGLLKTLGLDCLIEVYEAGAMPAKLAGHLSAIVDTKRLDAGDANRRESLETMLTAHQDLVNAAPANLPKFQGVLEYLREDMRKLEEN